jgi:hypothetical protein
MDLFKRRRFLRTINVSFLVVTIIVLFTNISIAGEIDLPEGGTLQAQDTIPLKDFTAVYYIKCDSDGHRWGLGNVIIIYKNKQEVLTIDEGGAGISNICAIMTPESAGYVKKSDTCYFGDINGDKIDEIVIESYSGGAHCCFNTWIFAIKDSLEPLLKIDMCEFGDRIVDLNNDSIPEILTWDNAWASWRTANTQYTAYIPLVIWSWDKDRYRVANIKFADYLISSNNLDSYKTSSQGSSKQQEDFYEESLWGPLINNYYAGRADLADSLFNACWPAQDTMKLKIYQQFQQRLRWSKYWPQVLESKW